jgi:hypothetical protein
MKQRLAMRVLGEIMGWDDERSQREFAWLRLMSDFKYDGYREFVAGARFIESLADWLQQFDVADEREKAYKFVRGSLLFFSAAEIQHLVELVYPEVVQPRLMRSIASGLRTPPYLVWSQPSADQKFQRLLRQSLFLGLSDGARIDGFRRTNAGKVSNEQVVLVTEIGPQKWNRLIEDLRHDLHDETARFAFMFLLDDFAGTGKTLLRKDRDEWKGRLHRLWEGLESSVDSVLEPNAVICVHHYIATDQAREGIKTRYQQMVTEQKDQKWFENVEFSYGLILPQNICVSEVTNHDFYELTQKYYDSSIETRHTAVGGSNVKLGFGGAALPLVLEHNTPNNSVALLWAESNGDNGTTMRPLFRRRQRHSG